MSDMLLEGKAQGGQLKLAGAGAWTAQNARALEALIDGFQSAILVITETVAGAAGELHANSEIMTRIAEQTRRQSGVAATAARGDGF